MSSAKLLITPSLVSSGEGENQSTLPVGAWFASKEMLTELVTSQDLVGRVLRRLQLEMDIDQFRSEITVEPLYEDAYYGRVVLVRISLASDSPDESKRRLDALVGEFISYTQELSAAEYASTRKYLQQLADEARDQTDKCQTHLQEWRSQHEGTTFEQVAAERSQRLADLENSRSQNLEQANKLRLQVAQLQAYTSGSTPTPPWEVLDQNDSLSHLQQQVDEAQSKLTELQRVFTDKNEDVRRQRDQVARLQGLLQSQVKLSTRALLQSRQAELKAAEQNIGMLDEQIKDLKKQEDLTKSELEYRRLERQLDLWDSNLEELTKQLYRARMAEQSSRRQGAMTVLEPAVPGVAVLVKVQRPVTSQAVLAIPFAVLFGLAAAWVAEYLSRSMRLRPRVEDALDLPVLGTIPTLRPDQLQGWNR